MKMLKVSHLNKECKILVVFNDMIAEMLNNKTYSNKNCNIFQRKKTKQFSCLYHTILFCFTKKS